MARPRKDSELPDAKQRLTEAFWELLETNQLHEISIGMLCARAACNRGTFYYHYQDIEDLIETIISNELFADNSIPNAIFRLVTGANDQNTEHALAVIVSHLEQLSLLIEKGGEALLNSRIKKAVIDMWETVFSVDGGSLTEQTRLIVEYASSGILGIIAYSYSQNDHTKSLQASNDFRNNMAGFLIDQISLSQGVPKEEILSRLLMVGHFANLSKNGN